MLTRNRECTFPHIGKSLTGLMKLMTVGMASDITILMVTIVSHPVIIELVTEVICRDIRILSNDLV